MIGPQRLKTSLQALWTYPTILYVSIYGIVYHLLSASVYCSTWTHSKMGVEESLYLHVLGDIFLILLLTYDV